MSNDIHVCPVCLRVWCPDCGGCGCSGVECECADSDDEEDNDE